jgi:hypothetical protein
MNNEVNLEYVWLITNEVVADLNNVDNLDESWVTDIGWDRDLNISEVLDITFVNRGDDVIERYKVESLEDVCDIVNS